MALSRLRRSYPEFQARSAELVEVGPNVPSNAVWAFRLYLGGRELEFPHLCDPSWSVHARYGLRLAEPDEAPAPVDPLHLRELARQRAVRPVPTEARRLQANPMQQGLYVVDEIGRVRYAYVTTPTGPLPPPATLLAVLDGSTG